jgi:starch-binding outer membrane protein, SusD/RagB family
MKNSVYNKIIRFLSVLFILVAVFSCSDDFFNQKAGNRIFPEDHYKSILDLEVSLLGAITPLQEVLPNLIVVDGLRTDLMDVTSNADGEYLDVYDQNLIFGNSLFNVSALYKVIIDVNEILANAKKVAEVDPNYNVDFEKQSNNMLIALRSWAYFQLLRLNGKVAYIPDNMVELPASQTFITKDAMIDTLINQLTHNIHRDTKVTELLFQNIPNGKALLGELYLEKNQYDSAAYYLKFAMEVQGYDKMYKVSAFSKDSWRDIFIGGESSSDENIGVIPFNGSEDQRNPLANIMLPSHQYLVKPSDLLFNLYLAQTPLKGSNGDFFRGIGVTVDTLDNINERYISKYTLVEGIDMYSGDIIFQRCADIHMKLAEAVNRKGDYKLALALINQGIASEKVKPTGYTKWNKNVGIRGRAYLASRTIPDEVTDPNQIMELVEDMIVEERAMDLAFEGTRMFDLIRIAERRGNPDYLVNKIAAKYPVEKQDEIRNKLRNESNWYLPL